MTHGILATQILPFVDLALRFHVDGGLSFLKEFVYIKYMKETDKDIIKDALEGAKDFVGVSIVETGIGLDTYSKLLIALKTIECELMKLPIVDTNTLLNEGVSVRKKDD